MVKLNKSLSHVGKNNIANQKALGKLSIEGMTVLLFICSMFFAVYFSDRECRLLTLPTMSALLDL